MRIGVVFRQDIRNDAPVICYAQSYVDAFKDMGHEVFTAGEGHPLTLVDELPAVDAIVEIENGRSETGELRFQVPLMDRTGVMTAVVLIDSHGHPDHHAAVARAYDHVFFAVWARRDLFTQLPSTHWCPNATDWKWFGKEQFSDIPRVIDFGFFGSRRGLSRADDLVEICKRRGWSYDVREVVKSRRNRWPTTGKAMAACKILYNKSQKHDGPNQRVMESMAVGAPLLNDIDARSGMDQLFDGMVHYVPYDVSCLEKNMEWLLEHTEDAATIAQAGCEEVRLKHQVSNRAAQVMEVLNA